MGAYNDDKTNIEMDKHGIWFFNGSTIEWMYVTVLEGNSLTNKEQR